MSAASELSLEGGCACRNVRYQASGEPLIVHCCHCHWCQRESGSAFVINALYSAERVTYLGADPNLVVTPSQSGKGQTIARCPKCHVAVWSNYSGGGPLVRFVRVGTLDGPHRLAPDVHIYTGSKAPWVGLPEEVPTFTEFYDVTKIWAREVDERRYAVWLKIQAARASRDAGSNA
ncbi:uncharacterized protein A1O9_04109 [Exophiala aquamarina CBS 119918]|uniref:CENP-V/GFA domain-containing protein n=1 Tax=Exophiala aquamarina CBS 119918 TaxID=1182545 RepID=A0A072PUT9_9EURO|nr:uncharacterized protein A1O9_04109 [Exophiala aquamarina CBS 119918]KEF59265.1 hypothetical protein A1O9_04109 [Exophiala aquamarina CBS 119918]